MLEYRYMYIERGLFVKYRLWFRWDLVSSPHYTRGIWKRRFHSEKRIKCFPSKLGRRNLKRNNESLVIFEVLFEENPVREITYRDAIVLEKLRLQNIFHPHENEEPKFSNSSIFATECEWLA